jgi:sporulation protein YlmC with PRC-barrel domain
MPPLDIDTALAWRGKTVRDRHGEKIGRLGDVYLDRETELPAYAAVNTGLFGTKETYLRLDDAELVDDDVQVPYDRQVVLDAPRIDPEVALNAHEEALLDEHYGAPNPTASAEGEMVRSEEEVQVRTEPVKRRERVRLRKHIVTDHVEKKVPVRREEIRVEHDPPREGRIVDVQDAGEREPGG